MVASIKRLSTELNDAANLFGVNIAAGANAKIYENLAVDTTAIVKELTLCNTSELPALVTIAIKTNAEVIGLSNAIFYKAYLAARQTAVIELSSVIEAGKGLYVAAGAGGGSVNVSCQGVELLNASAKQLTSSILTDTFVSKYTTPQDKESVVYQILATNGDTAETSLTVQFVPAAGQPDSKNAILFEVPIQPNETLMFRTKTALPEGYRIMAKASRKNIVHLVIDGTEK